MHDRRARCSTRGATVVGVDNFDPYYDVALKEARARDARGPAAASRSSALDLADAAATAQLFRDGAFTHVVHLAAQPGVRYSLVNPAAYLRNNVDAFGHVLEGCRHARRRASRLRVVSSSVYGANHTLPFSEDQPVDHPVSLYAATKKRERADGAQLQPPVRPADDGPALLHRLRTVGPARHGADAVHARRSSRASRSASSTTARCAATSRTSTTSSKASCARSARPPAARRGRRRAARDLQHRQPRGGRARDVHRDARAPARPRRAIRDYQPMQPGDVPATYASIDRLRAATGFAPRTPLADGLARFVDWYRDVLPLTRGARGRALVISDAMPERNATGGFAAAIPHDPRHRRRRLHRRQLRARLARGRPASRSSTSTC